MSKPRLLFVVESPFSERDRGRFGIEELERSFDVHVLDTTPVLAPRAWAEFKHLQCDFGGLSNLYTTADLSRYIETLRPHVVISGLGHHDLRARLLHESRVMGAIRAEFWLGVIPEDDLIQSRSLRSLLFRLRRQPSKTVFSSAVSRFSNLYRTPQAVLDDTPDIFFFAGMAARELSNQQVSHFVPVPSLDTETARGVALHPINPSTPMAVYLDQDIGYHSDFTRGSYRVPADGACFHQEFRNFAREFEVITKVKTVVAPHPRADREHLAQRFGDLPISSQPTPELIRDSALVLAHCSTAVSFAVYFRKPILLLVTRQLRRGWYGPLIADLGRRLKVPILDMSRFSREAVLAAAACTVDEATYAEYQYRYMDSGTSEAPLWAQVAEALLRELAARR